MATKPCMCSAIHLYSTIFQFQFVYKTLILLLLVLFYPHSYFSSSKYIYTFHFPTILRMLSTKNLSLCTALHEWGCRRVRKEEEKKYPPCLRRGYEDLQKKIQLTWQPFSIHTHTIRNEKTKEKKNVKIMECWKPNKTKRKNRAKREKKRKKKSTEMIQEENGQHKNEKNKHSKDRRSIECATIFIHCV